MLKLAGGIVNRGIKIDLVLARKEGPLLNEVPDGVNVVDLNVSRTLFSLNKLVQFLKVNRPTSMLTGLHANFVGLWAKRIARIPSRIVISERNCLSVNSLYYSRDIRMRLSPYFARRFYPWADRIIAVSKAVAQDLIRNVRISENRIQTIYNPIITPDLISKSKAPIDHPWFNRGAPPTILSVGRLTAQKDYPTLIKAFSQLHKVSQARLLILGEGEQRNELEALVKQLGLENVVSLPGFVSNPYPYMTRARLFVLCSRWEGLPGVLIEALFCNSPVIATDCPGGSQEILNSGKYGVLVPVGDVDTLASTMLRSLNKQIAPPPKESWEPFELETIVDKYLEILL
jgi:glycosyltransferase involved in cell wall biosynthesis